MPVPRPLPVVVVLAVLLLACGTRASEPDRDRETAAGDPAAPSTERIGAGERDGPPGRVVGRGDDPDGDERGGGGEPGADRERDADEGEADGEGSEGDGTPPAPHPVRGAWVHLFDDAIKSRAGIEAVVEELAAAGATTVVAQVTRRHDAYYDSDVLPRTADPELEEGLDVLGYLLETAHAHDLDVHAWIAVAPTWHHVYDDLPAPAGWLPAAHGHRAPEEQRWVTRTIDGEWSDYLDPALPEVGDHLASVVAEITRRYPVDGIHLDYVRYPSERHGYHPRALERFRRETGATGTPPPEDPVWSEWRRERTTGLLRRATGAVEAIDPDVLISAAVIAWGEGPGGPSTPTFQATRAHDEALQDWATWAREGLVDVLMPMVYFRQHDAQQARWFEQWTVFQRAVADQADVRVVPGVGAWLNAPSDVLRQVRAAATVGDGVMLYSQQQPSSSDDHDVWERLARTAWGTRDAP